MMFARLIGWLAERFPGHVFYSRHFMPEIRTALGEGDDPHVSEGNTAMLGTAIAAGRIMSPGDILTTEWTGVTDGGRNLGDFRMTIERAPFRQMNDGGE